MLNEVYYQSTDYLFFEKLSGSRLWLTQHNDNGQRFQIQGGTNCLNELLVQYFESNLHNQLLLSLTNTFLVSHSNTLIYAKKEIEWAYFMSSAINNSVVLKENISLHSQLKMIMVFFSSVEIMDVQVVSDVAEMSLRLEHSETSPIIVLCIIRDDPRQKKKPHRFVRMFYFPSTHEISRRFMRRLCDHFQIFPRQKSKPYQTRPKSVSNQSHGKYLEIPP